MQTETPRTDEVCNQIADLAYTLRAAGCSSLSLQQLQVLIRKQLEKLRDHARILETELNAWHATFGTTQLTHAIARLEAAEKRAAAGSNDQAQR